MTCELELYRTNVRRHIATSLEWVWVVSTAGRNTGSVSQSGYGEPGREDCR